MGYGRRYLIMEEDPFAELQNDARRPDDGLPLESFDDLFPRLVFIMLTAEPDLIEEDSGWERRYETRFHMHLYGPITPMELVRASVSRPLFKEDYAQRFDSFLTKWHESEDGNDSDTTESESSDEAYTEYSYEDSYDDELLGLTLHKHARLITNDKFPLASLLKPIIGGWRISPWREVDDEYLYAPRLDIRHLTQDSVALSETLQGCAWLLQGEIEEGCKKDTVAEVDCRLEVVQPLLQTVSPRDIPLHANPLISVHAVCNPTALGVLYHTVRPGRRGDLCYESGKHCRLPGIDTGANETRQRNLR